MKLKTTITKETEIEITIPFFRKYDKPHWTGILEVCAVLDEKTFCKVFNSEDLTYVSIDAVDRNIPKIVEISSKWEPITEEEFLAAHAAALKSLSLVPELVEKNDIKDVLQGPGELEKEIEKELDDYRNDPDYAERNKTQY